MTSEKEKGGRKCPRKPIFQEGEDVLCYRGPFLYKAKCAKVSVKYKNVKYQVHYFGVKDRDSPKSRIPKSLSSTSEAARQPLASEASCQLSTSVASYRPSTREASCQSSTSEAEAAYSEAFTDTNSTEAGECFKECPSPQADWEEEWLPQGKLLKYSKANLRKLHEVNRAKLREGIGPGPITREKASALQKEHDQASDTMIPKARTPRRQLIRFANIDSTSYDKRGYRASKDNDKSDHDMANDDKPGCSSTSDDQPGCSTYTDDQPGCSITSGKPSHRRGRPPRRQKQPPGRQKRPPGQRRRSRKRPAHKTHVPSDSDNEKKPDQNLLGNTARKVHIPEVLKQCLLNDWDMIVGQNQLFHLPAKKTVDSILEDYQEYESIYGNRDEKWMEDVRESVVGIKAYFNIMLGSQLLYRFERPQYAEMLENLPGVPLTQIYGGPHLLRLFVKVEEMLTYTPIEQGSLVLLLQHLHNVLDYLANNCLILFDFSKYHFVPLEYFRKAFY